MLHSGFTLRTQRGGDVDANLKWWNDLFMLITAGAEDEQNRRILSEFCKKKKGTIIFEVDVPTGCINVTCFRVHRTVYPAAWKQCLYADAIGFRNKAFGLWNYNVRGCREAQPSIASSPDYVNCKWSRQTSDGDCKKKSIHIRHSHPHYGLQLWSDRDKHQMGTAKESLFAFASTLWLEIALRAMKMEIELGFRLSHNDSQELGLAYVSNS